MSLKITSISVLTSTLTTHIWCVGVRKKVNNSLSPVMAIFCLFVVFDLIDKSYKIYSFFEGIVKNFALRSLFRIQKLKVRICVPGYEGLRTDMSHPIHGDNCLLKDSKCEKKPPAYTWRDYR